MPVLAPAVTRADVLLYRSSTNQWGVLWERSSDGANFTPVNLAGWTGKVILRSPLGEEWHVAPVATSASGLTTITLPPSVFETSAWATRTGGTWAVTITAPDGTTERLAEGYFALES